MFLWRLILPMMGMGAWATAGVAQTITGQVRSSSEPVAFAVVAVEDSVGTRRTVLTDSSGHFRIDLPHAGTYSLTVRRVGLQDQTVPAARVAADAVVTLTVETIPEALALPALTVRSRSQCGQQSRSAEVALLWQEIEKALEAADIAQRTLPIRYQVVRYSRTLEPRTMRVLRERAAHTNHIVTGSPYVSVPATELAARGFRQATDSGTYYYAPDAAVLVSAAFLNAHCLRREAAVPGGPLRLSFEPATQARPGGLRGTFVVDAATHRLRSVEYQYVTGEAANGAADPAAGRVDFAMLPNGVWMVAEWSIRMPTWGEQVMNTSGGMRLMRALRSLEETGGMVLAALDTRGMVLWRAGEASIEGTIVDALGTPARDAVVSTEHVASAGADSTGRYHLRNLRPGRYRVLLTTPDMRLFDVSRDTTITLAAGTTLQLDWSAAVIPSWQALSSRCPVKSPEPSETGRIAGRLTRQETGEPVAGASLTASWLRVSVDERVWASTAAIAATTDELGLFWFCHVHRSRPISITLTHPQYEMTPVAIPPLGDPGFAKIDLRVGTSASGVARKLSGTLYD